MATSSLDPDLIPGKDRQLGKGHGTASLGPSDLSDSGSDIAGGVAWENDADTDLGLDSGTSADVEAYAEDGSAAGDIGDTDFDSDSDAGGTAEQATAGRDTRYRAGRDIDTDRTARLSDVADPAGTESIDEDEPGL